VEVLVFIETNRPGSVVMHCLISAFLLVSF